MSWDQHWQAQIALNASKSKDRSRQVGCVIVNDRNVALAQGWNGFPRGVSDDVDDRHQRPAKYAWTEHAERNAIYNAASEGIRLRGATIHLSWFPCVDCARGIIQTGLAEVVCIEPDWNDPSFDFKISLAMLTEAGVQVRYVEGQAPVRKEHTCAA